MSVLSRSAAVIVSAMLIASVYSLTPLLVGAATETTAGNDSFDGREGVPVVVAAPGVTNNDFPSDSATLLMNIELVSGPSVPGVLVLDSGGGFTYTPTDLSYSGPVTFTYTISDDLFATSTAATVTIHIADNPSSANQTLTTLIDTASSSALTYLDGDTSGNLFTFATTSDPLNGTISLNTANGAFIYTPNSAYVGPDEFKWVVGDGGATSTEATVSITVLAAPQIGISFVVVSNNGVVATTSDNALFDGATTTGATTTASVGAHTIAAIPLAGYTTTIGGACASDGTITLVGGQMYHCVITHTQNGSPAPAAEEQKPANGPISTIGPSFGMISTFSGSVLGASTTASTTSLPELPPGCTPMLSGFFRKERMQNDSEQVKKLQQFLNDKLEANLPLTGEFGAGTDAAVKRFQMKYADQILSPWGISAPTGFVYLTTQRWINLMSCSSLALPMPKLVPYRG